MSLTLDPFSGTRSEIIGKWCNGTFRYFIAALVSSSLRRHYQTYLSAEAGSGWRGARSIFKRRNIRFLVK